MSVNPRWSYSSGQGIPAFKTVFTSMDKFINSFYFSPTERLVPMDVVETEKAYELRIAVPGLAKDEIKVDVKSGCLTVEAKKVEVNGDENYVYKGLSSFEFNRSFSDLDENLKVDMENISSKYRNGLLIISLPKKQEAMPREISVEVS